MTATLTRRTRIRIRAQPRRAARRPQSVTLAEAAELWLASLPAALSSRGRVYSPATVRLYSITLRQMAAALGDVAMADVTGDAVDRWLATQRRAGAAEGSLSVRQAIVGAFLSWCEERAMVGRNPLSGRRKIKAPLSPVSVFSDEEVRRLLRLCDQRTWMGSRNHAAALILLRTGLRASELCALDCPDFDRQSATLQVRHGKGDRPRVVGVPPDAAVSLGSWLSLWNTDGPLFPAEQGQRLTYRGLQGLVRRLGLRAGIADCHPHRFRHTFAVTALRNGLDLYQLMTVLGHERIDTTARYLRGIQAEDAAAAHVRAFRSVR